MSTITQSVPGASTGRVEPMKTATTFLVVSSANHEFALDEDNVECEEVSAYAYMVPMLQTSPFGKVSEIAAIRAEKSYVRKKLTEVARQLWVEACRAKALEKMEAAHRAGEDCSASRVTLSESNAICAAISRILKEVGA